MKKVAYTVGWHEALTAAAVHRLRQQGYDISPEQERRIIDANASTDLYALKHHYAPETKPFHYMKDTAGQTKQVISWLLNQAKKNDDYTALDALGIATHVAQDKYSHKELGLTSRNALYYHLAPGAKIYPDDPHVHPYLARKAVKRTERILKTVLKKRKGLPQAPDKGTPIAYDPSIALYRSGGKMMKSSSLLLSLISGW